MTEENTNETTEREPFDFQDPSENRVVADDHPVDEPVQEDPAPEVETPEVEAAEEPPAEVKAAQDLGDLDQYIDSDLAKALSGMIGELRGEIADLKKAATDAATNASHEQFFATNDELFGSDAPSPDQKKNRDSIRGQMDILKAGYKAAGKKVPNARILFDKALRSEFPDATIETARKQVATKVQNRERKMVARPTSRAAESSDARSRATEAVAKRMRELGLG